MKNKAIEFEPWQSAYIVNSWDKSSIKDIALHLQIPESHVTIIADAINRMVPGLCEPKTNNNDGLK